jgi:8-oxo-dGTP pyrophosphatase MutT (NUDIX family)
MNLPYAVFVFAPTSSNLFAATTRPNLPNTYGLPGGKIDKSDISNSLSNTLHNAILREASEEGWLLDDINTDIVYQTFIENEKLVVWITAQKATKLQSFKEQGRISPVELPLKELAPFYNNSNAIIGYELYKATRTP